MMTTLETRQKIYRCELCMNKRDAGEINEALNKACSAIQLGYTAVANAGTSLFPKADVPAASLAFSLMGWMHLERVIDLDPKNPIALSLLCSLELLEGSKSRAQILLNRLLRCKYIDRASLALGKIIEQEITKETENVRWDKILERQFRVLQKLEKLEHE
jgi:hypothetical protein